LNYNLADYESNRVCLDFKFLKYPIKDKNLIILLYIFPQRLYGWYKSHAFLASSGRDGVYSVYQI